ncbi:MAG: PKD domain-containing protein [Daejeonella sp.]
MCNRIIFGLSLFLCLGLLSPVKAQNVSNEGTEFWAVFPSHVPATLQNNFRPLANYSIFITGKQASSGVVTVGTFSQRFNLAQANTVITVQIPRSAAYIDNAESNRVLSNKAIKVQVDPGKPKVVVYGHIFAGARSAASLILPKEALGQQYFSMNYTSGNTTDGGLNHIVLVATEPDTRIFLKRNGADLIAGGVFLPKTGDVYEYLSNLDLTGVSVSVDPETSACKKFAMFSGTTNSSITASSGCFGDVSSDPLYQQNYPVESWGKTYGFIPFSSKSPSGSNVRTQGNYIRVVAKQNSTPVQFNGILVATLNAGQYYQTPRPTNEPTFITSSKSIAVAQYSLTQSCAGGGVSDPDMVILNPVEYNIKNITVYSSDKEDISQNYVNVLIKTSAAASFRINGAVPRGTFTVLRSAPEYSYLQLNLNQYATQIFNLSASDGFNAIAYGFGDVESYAYSAGTNLASSQFAVAVSPDTEEEIVNACTKESFNVKVTLTSPISALSWQFEENGTAEEQLITTSVPVVRNGTTFYDYYFPRTVSYQNSGPKTIRVIAKYPSIGGCALSEQQIDLVFTVFDPPEARFKTSANFCATSEIEFTDESIDQGNPITAWRWDFGDGFTSTEQNPKHSYSSPGLYTVKLKVENSTSCNGVVSQQDITIKAIPIPAFTFSKPGCDNSSIIFTDGSSVPVGRIVKWSWDFGDGNKSEKDSAAPFSYQYTTRGSHEISLTVTSDNGCESTLNQILDINIPFLNAGNDTIMLRGGAISFNVNASGTNLKYKWSPSVGLDRDDIKNPIASPTEDTQYTLTISSEEGCVLSDDIVVRVVDKPVIRNTFTPNGDGVNDVWEIDYLESYPEVRVDIFNRFGVKVHNSIGYLTPWNGMFNGSELPVGTYYYVIDPKSGLPVYTGWVTVLR